MKKRFIAAPVDQLSLRGLTTHAESHWLTFATALNCYAKKPKRSSLKQVANRHGPKWLRAALYAASNSEVNDRSSSTLPRPKELDPKTGSLAYLTAGAEEALKKPEEKPLPSYNRLAPLHDDAALSAKIEEAL